MEASVKNVDAFITLSHSSKGIHCQMGLNVPIVNLPPFVSSAEVALPTSEQPFGETLQEPYFLFVGRLEKLKGLQTLIPVFHNYRKAQLLIAGTGNDEPYLRQLAEGSDNIRFLGYVPQRQLQSLYRRAVAVIVPSLCYEIFPLVIIEAFREQAPVIARNQGGMPEIIEESGGGFVYNADEGLVAAMDRLLAEPSYRRELGLRGYQAYQQNWTPDAHLKRYLGLICEIAAGLAAKRRS